MQTYVCDDTGLTVEAETMPAGWLEITLKDCNGDERKYLVCSIWQAADLMTKIANNG